MSTNVTDRLRKVLLTADPMRILPFIAVVESYVDIIPDDPWKENR
jgi:hypothetical protein